MINSKEDIEGKLKQLTSSNRDESIKMLNEILELIPKEYSNYIHEAFKYKMIPKEYMLSSILFAVSSSIGMTFNIEAIGFQNYANLYFIIVGSRGDAKSEALKLATEPINHQDNEYYNDYIKSFNSELENDLKPVRKQILLQNATIEGAHKVHYENPNSIGVFIDEIFYLIESMSNPNSRDGGDWKQFFLQSYTNSHVDIVRKTTKSFRLSKTYVSLLGGIQNEFISKIFANGNLQSGFIDRLLFTPILTENTTLLRGLIDEKVVAQYNLQINNILSYKKQSEQKEEVKKNFKICCTAGAEDLLYTNKQDIIDRKKNANPVIKEYHSKMNISIHKFVLLIHLMKMSNKMDSTLKIDKSTVELAILINEYFFNNFKIILEENFKLSRELPTLDDVINLAIKNDAQQKSVMDITKVSKGTVSKHWKKIKEKQETGN